MGSIPFKIALQYADVCCFKQKLVESDKAKLV